MSRDPGAWATSPFQRLRVLRFVATGGAGFVLDAALLAALAPTLGPIVAQVLAYAVAMVVTFALNRGWTFQARSPHWATQGRRYLVISLAGAMALNGGYAMAVWDGSPPMLALGLCAGSWAAVSYILLRRWVFRASPVFF